VPLFLPLDKIKPRGLHTRSISRLQHGNKGPDDMVLDDEGTSGSGDAFATPRTSGNVSPAISGSMTPAHDPNDAGESEISAYTFATFAALEWEKYSIARAWMFSKRATDLRYSAASFAKISERFQQFGRRFVFIRSKPSHKVRGEWLIGPRPDIGGKHLPCDDAFAHGDNVMAVFDGVGDGGHASGSFARVLADQTRISSREATSGDLKNRSYEILRLAHEKTRETFRECGFVTQKSRIHRDGFPGSSTASVVSLIQKGGRSELHCSWHGDSQIAIMGPGPDYTPKFVSVRSYYDGFRELIPGTRVKLRRDFKDLKKGADMQVLDICTTLGIKIHASGGGIYVEKKDEGKYLELRHNPYPTQLCLRPESFAEHNGPGQQILQVENGDIVLVASDGLFDNFFDDKHDKTRWKKDTDEDHEKAYAQELGLKLQRFFKMFHKEQEDSDGWIQRVGKKLSDQTIDQMKPDRGGHMDDLTIMISQITSGQIQPEHAPIHIFDYKSETRKDPLKFCQDINTGMSIYCTSFAPEATRVGTRVTPTTVAAGLGGAR